MYSNETGFPNGFPNGKGAFFYVFGFNNYSSGFQMKFKTGPTLLGQSSFLLTATSLIRIKPENRKTKP